MLSKPKILITGATGTVGSHLVKRFSDANLTVRALVRDIEKAKRMGLQAEIVYGDLTKPETLHDAFNDIDRIFVVSNGIYISVLEGNVYEAAVHAGVERIVKISGRHLNADFMQQTPLSELQRMSEQKLKMTGIPWTIIRPGYFATNFLTFTDWSNNVVALPVGDGKETPTDPRDIAEVGFIALMEDGHEGAIYEITGPDYLTYAEMTDIIAEETGTPLRMVDAPRDMVEQGLLSTGVPVTQAKGIMVYFDAVKAGKIYPPTRTIEQITGKKPADFDTWVRDHREALAG